jgi:hypothetical protein
MKKILRERANESIKLFSTLPCAVIHPRKNFPVAATRLYVLNAEPNLWSAFHTIGAIFGVVYTEGNPRNATYGHQVVNIAPAGGVICEITLHELGLYPLVTLVRPCFQRSRSRAQSCVRPIFERCHS